MHSFNFGISQLIYIHGDDGTCPVCPYSPGDFIEVSLNNLMQLIPRIIVREDQFKDTTGVDIRQGGDPFRPPGT